MTMLVLVVDPSSTSRVTEISAPSECNLANKCGLVVVHNLEHVLDGLYDHHAKTRVSRSHHLSHL